MINVMNQVVEKENSQLVESGKKRSSAEAGDAIGLREKRLSSKVEVLSSSLACSQLRIQLWIHEHKLFLCDL